MLNKNYCQGPNCHTRDTKDRYQASTGLYRSRYAYWTRKDSNGWLQYFCTNGCMIEWVNQHLDLIFKHRALPKFIDIRKTMPKDEVLDR
jgi:hypothetical protein